MQIAIKYNATKGPITPDVFCKSRKTALLQFTVILCYKLKNTSLAIIINLFVCCSSAFALRCNHHRKSIDINCKISNYTMNISKGCKKLVVKLQTISSDENGHVVLSYYSASKVIKIQLPVSTPPETTKCFEFWNNQHSFSWPNSKSSPFCGQCE